MERQMTTKVQPPDTRSLELATSAGCDAIPDDDLGSRASVRVFETDLDQLTRRSVTHAVPLGPDVDMKVTEGFSDSKRLDSGSGSHGLTVDHECLVFNQEITLDA